MDNGPELSSSEQDLLDAARRGEVLELGERPDPADRQISADMLYRLCVRQEDAVHSKGVRLRGAIIRGKLDFEAATLRVPLVLETCSVDPDRGGEHLPVAINLEQASGSWISFAKCAIHGAVSAQQVRIAHTLTLKGATVDGPVRLGGANIAGDLDMSDAQVSGDVWVADTTITRNLIMGGARLTGTDVDGDALSADRVDIGGSVFFRSLGDEPFTATGAVRLSGARIAGDLDMNRAQLGTNRSGNSLVAARIDVGGSVFMSGSLDGYFTAAGAVRLNGAKVAGNLAMDGATLGANSDGAALIADGVTVLGSVLLSGSADQPFTAAGSVRLSGANIGGRLDITGPKALPDLDLTETRCSSFSDSESAWPAAGHVKLIGFEFKMLDDRAGVAKRLESVRRQGYERWSPDPYEQLAAFYTRTGNEVAARTANIAKHDDELRHLKFTRKPGTLRYRFWRYPFGWLLGYGYRRRTAGWLLALVIAITSLAFWRFHEANALAATSPLGASQACGSAYPCFNAPVYGADIVLPIIDFGQDEAWRPNSQVQWGALAEAMRWFCIAIGWILTSVFVAAFTRLVGRD